MYTIWPWIKKYPLQSTLLAVSAFSVPLIIVDLLFKIPAINDWFTPAWGADSLLSYIAGFESFLGTLLLGIITVYQNNVSQKVTEQLAVENNTLQKISVQRLLPILKIMQVTLQPVDDNPTLLSNWENLFSNEPIAVVEAHTKDQIKFDVHVKLGSFSSKRGIYKKTITLSLENISESVINRIALEKIEFPEYKEWDKIYPEVILESKETVYTLLLPKECAQLTFDIYYTEDVYRKHWEGRPNALGYFCMNMTIKCTSVFGIEHSERVYIGKQQDAKARVVYWE